MAFPDEHPFAQLRRRAERSVDDLRRRYGNGSDPHAALRATLGAQVPYLAGVWGPPVRRGAAVPEVLRVATYNVHRWAGVRGGNAFVPARAARVLERLDADVIALQEVLRPFDTPDLLADLADRLGRTLAFATTRIHRNGELGNAILTRLPLSDAFTLDLTTGRLEQRSALAVTLGDAPGRTVSIVATHLSLVDRTRKLQVQRLLSEPRLGGNIVLMGDMNAWRKCPAVRDLEDAFVDARHHNDAWPASYPAMAPVLALDRIYARGADVTALATLDDPDARQASDHLPVCAEVRLG